MKTKRLLNIVFKILVVFAILLQVPVLNCNNVYADDISSINDFPKDDSVKYNGKISYAGNIVGDFTVNGIQAFCMAHPKPTPPTGTKLTSEIYRDVNVQKVLYYGWNGPEQWSGFESRSHGIVVTSLALSYYYYGDNSSPKTIEKFIDYVEKHNTPSYTLGFSKEKVTAYKDGNVQKTENITLISDRDTFGITVTLPNNVTYVDVTHGIRQTGGSVTIKGKTTFYLEASLNVKIDTWYTGEKVKGYYYSPILSTVQVGNYQPLGRIEKTYDPSKTTSLTVDWLQLGSIEITKNDIYGNLIDGAVFRLWNDNGYDQNITVTNGKIKIENLVTGNYFLQEQTAPNGFLVDKTIYTINLNASDDIKQIVSNKEPRGTITVTKKDNYGNKVGNTKFYVKANGDIRSAGGNLLYPNGTTVDTLVTNANGVDTTVELPIGNYVVEEYEVPYGYLLNKNKFNVSLKYANQDTPLVTTSTSVVNDEPKGTITVTKTNNLSDKVANAKFHIKADGNVVSAGGKVLYSNGAIVDTLTTNASGVDTTVELPLGNYIVEEYEVPHGYLLNKNKYKVSLKYANQNTPLVTTSTTVTNSEPLGTIEFQKEVDSDITNNLKGDVFLSNLKYGLYARNDIKNVAGTKTYYTKDTLISQKTTDEKGRIEWNDLHIGDYYLKELETNDSLLINSTPINVSLTYKDMNTSVVSSKTSAKDIIASQRIQIFKEGIKDGIAGVVAGLQGAEFTFKLSNEYNHVGWDNAKTYYVGTTDKNGFLTTDLLPYGTYRVRETKTPEGYYGASDFLITIERDSSLYEIGYKIKKVTVNNVPFETLLKIRKADSETDKTVLKKGNVYKLKNLDKDEYVSYVDWSQFPNIHVDKWETHEDGTITLNTMLQAGHYQLEEIDCSEGYLLNKEPLKFELTKDMDYDIAEDGVTPIVTITFENKPVKGKIKLSKEGEVLTGYDEKEKNFIYEKIGLANAVYDILAEKDILDPCNDKTVLYHAGEVVDTITTNESGKAESKLLPLGDYEVKEKESPSGFVLNNEVKKVSLTYEDKETEIVYEDVEFYNERQKVEIETSKQDSDTQDYVEGAELTLKANRDIYNYKGDVIVKAGTLLETVVSNSKGKVKFVTDLPNDLTLKDGVMPIDDLNDDIDNDFSQMVVEGVRLIGDPNSLFMVYESKEPIGYMPYKLNYYIDTSYTNQNQKVLKFETPFFNDITVTEVLKTNGIDLLNGAHMQILDEKGKVYDEWISDGTSHMSKGLPLDKELILHEVEPPHGYTLADDIKFIVRDYQKIEMIDKPIVRFRKLDSDSKIFVKGVHMQIIEKETDKTVYDFITDDKAMNFVFDYGKTYIAREIETVESYYKNVEDVEFIATPNLTVDFYNSPIFTRLQVNKIDKDTKELIINNPFTFAVFADKNCTHLLDILETDSNKGIALSQIVLRYGKVYLKEIKAPDGYIINRDVIEININGELEGVGDIYTIVVENEKAPKPVITVTNDSTMIGIFVILFGASFCIFLKLRKCKKSK
ncbi:SpaA isopeptide-forming pilin-related protein [Coprobacillus cateniformis]|uniref:SpaA isopeptide-forming pilin-related protein n=1 Tax=Coprobacillus cateniformis TaxID=100884 RepID=UPI000E432C6A|nr:SpaA isopeptide-forming pilin-related protein [Coprobacillus cateniformis]RGO07629.1 sortase B protein-sorting domain-containing protein [Coprobacillus cateniformis]RGO16499.1 sortase B protein-sorting domain-containing protein [Coprobacillus cateniformis]